MDNKALWATDIVWRRIDNEVVVIKHDGRTLCTLNKTAAFIWEMCNGENAAQDIAKAVCQRFEINEEKALKDVRNTLADFLEIGLVGETAKIGLK
jgi:hypothetical protein